jgi:hypothetical protein
MKQQRTLMTHLNLSTNLKTFKKLTIISLNNVLDWKKKANKNAALKNENKAREHILPVLLESGIKL